MWCGGGGGNSMHSMTPGNRRDGQVVAALETVW